MKMFLMFHTVPGPSAMLRTLCFFGSRLISLLWLRMCVSPRFYQRALVAQVSALARGHTATGDVHPFANPADSKARTNVQANDL